MAIADEPTAAAGLDKHSRAEGNAEHCLQTGSLPPRAPRRIGRGPLAASRDALRSMVPPAAVPNLKLDLTTGTVTLPDGLQLSPQTTRQQLLALRDATWRVRTGAPPWRTYERDVRGAAGGACGVALTFEGEALRRLTLRLLPSPAGADHPSPGAPPEPDEQQRHMALAAELLGTDPAAAAAAATTMPWGRVRPCHDPRSDQGLLEIRYGDAASD